MDPFNRRSFIRLAAATGLTAPLAFTGPPASGEPGVAAEQSYRLRDVGPEHLPYYVATAGPLTGDVPVDRHGISMRVINGTNYDHPVLQAQFMLSRLSSYQVNHDPRFLAVVEAHAARIQSYSLISAGAAYLPYPFPFDLHGNPSWTLSAPWFSGMAQGQALGAFSRLARVTGKARYRAFADRLFASFSKIDDLSVPWAPVKNYDNNLWFEEYPRPAGQSDRAMNGHIFAIYGLYDYWQLTRSAAAEKSAVGGMSAVAAIFDRIRNPGWISHYCLTHRVRSTSYHRVHIAQLYQLFAFSGAVSFAKMADSLLSDYPSAQKGGRAYIAAGNHTALCAERLAESLKAVELSVANAEAAVCVERAKLAGHDGVFLQIASGSLNGYWVEELPKRSFIRSYIELYKFAEPRSLRFAKGTYTGHKFGANGVSTTKKTQALKRDSAAHVDKRAICNGVLYYRIADGIWNGWWIPADARVSLV